VIDVDLLSVVRRWHHRDGLPIREITRRTGLSRNTIRKYLANSEITPAYPARRSVSKPDPFAETLASWLARESKRNRKRRRNLKQLHRDLVALGFDGSYDRVAAFARDWRQRERERANRASRGAFVPLAFAPGEAFQFDWSENWLTIGKKKTKLQIARTKLCHSRAFVLRAYLTQTHEMLFDAHNHAFRVLRGVPERGIYGNRKTAVDNVGRGKKRLVNARFRAMVSLRAYADRIMLVAEAEVVAEHERVFSRDHNSKGVTVFDWRHYLAVVQRKPGALRSGAPFAELPRSFKRLQSVLMKREGGDREMADILALVLHHDEQLVEQAVREAIQSEVVSKTHILNRLSRLLDTPPPATLTPPPALALTGEPLANTERYDDLRGMSHVS
jgi:transposase